MPDGWAGWVLAVVVGLVVPVAIASTVQDMRWQAFVPVTAAAAAAVGVGFLIQRSGVEARTEDEPRDRLLS